jgi:hypothetical protein
MRGWLHTHAADIGLLAVVLAVLAWSWHGPAAAPPGGLQAAARTAVHRHLGAAAQDVVDAAVSGRERTARTVVMTRDPG